MDVFSIDVKAARKFIRGHEDAAAFADLDREADVLSLISALDETVSETITPRDIFHQIDEDTARWLVYLDNPGRMHVRLATEGIEPWKLGDSNLRGHAYLLSILIEAVMLANAAICDLEALTGFTYTKS